MYKCLGWNWGFHYPHYSVSGSLGQLEERVSPWSETAAAIAKGIACFFNRCLLAAWHPHLPHEECRRIKNEIARGNVTFTENAEKGIGHPGARPAASPSLTVSLSFPQPVVQCAESGPRVHRPGDPGDARRAGEPAKRRGAWASWGGGRCPREARGPGIPRQPYVKV